jgi:tripartite-type tricarboxylate transporter receptor subunit TctC
MISRRRQFLYLAGVAVSSAMLRIARAQSYPSRPVRIIVSAAAGGPTDLVARLTGQILSERLGQQFVVENRPGGGNNIGTETVVRSPADGYTLLLVNVNNAVNATLFDHLNFNFIQDIAPVASIARVALVIVVQPSVPVRTVPELIAYARANPGKLGMASGGNGSAPHVAGELFKLMTGTEMFHVPYRGNAPALIDLIGGQVQIMFADIPTSVDYIRAGKLRPLAVTAATRFPTLPDVPTVGEFVQDYEATGWYGLGAPRGVPVEIIEKLNNEINVILSDPKLKARLAGLGGTVLQGTPSDFGKLIANETDKWARLIRAAHIKPG